MENPDALTSLLLIGHQRSGTTLLGSIINSHPEVALMDELGCYWKINQSLGSYDLFIGKRWLRRKNNPFLYTLETDRSRVKGVGFLKNSLLITRFLWHIGIGNSGIVDEKRITYALGKLFPKMRIVGDKYPDSIFRMGMYTGEEIKIISIYRDPRDMVSSTLIKSRGEWAYYFPPELQEAGNVAKRWVKQMNGIEKFKDRIHTVCYEELVTSPKQVMEAVGSYLNLDPNGFKIEEVRTSSIGKYKTVLTEEELREVLQVTQDLMPRYGYKVDPIK